MQLDPMYVNVGRQVMHVMLSVQLTQFVKQATVTPPEI